MGEVIAIPDGLPVFRRPPGLPLTCSDADLAEAVKARLCGADDASIARLLHVPARAVKYWTDSREWAALVGTYLPEVEAILKGQLTRIANLALTQLDDRVSQGDFIYGPEGDKTLDDNGRPKRKALKARELSDIARTVFEQKKNLEKLTATITDEQERLALDKLARALRESSLAADRRERERTVDGTAERV